MAEITMAKVNVSQMGADSLYGGRQPREATERPMIDRGEVRRRAVERSAQEASLAAAGRGGEATRAREMREQKPVINALGQKTGSIINTTA